MSRHISEAIAAAIVPEYLHEDMSIYGETYIQKPDTRTVFFVESCGCNPMKPYNLTKLTRPEGVSMEAVFGYVQF